MASLNDFENLKRLGKLAATANVFVWVQVRERTVQCITCAASTTIRRTRLRK